MENNRVVLVTGSGKGLGAEFVKQIAADGSCVIVNNRRRDGEVDSAAEVANMIQAAGGQAASIAVDVTENNAAQRLVEFALETYGQLDAVVFNAGVNGTAGRFQAGALEDFRQVIDINFHSAVELAYTAWPHISSSEAGRLLFISSTAGLYGVKGRAAYAASKGAMNALAFSLALEGYKEGTRCNTLMPYAATKMTTEISNAELMELLAPKHVAPLTSWLTSKNCDLNGEIIVAGGGYMRRAVQVEERGSFIRSDESDDMRDHLHSVIEAGVLRPRGAESAFGEFLKELMGSRS